MAIESSGELVTDVLQIVREASTQGSSLALWEIDAQLLSLAMHFPRLQIRRRLPSILAGLSDLGLVAAVIDAQGERRWSVGPLWNLPGASGNGGRRGGDGPGQPLDGGGGGGVEEVLEHPVLFSLSRPDFNQLVDDLFEEIG